MNNFVNKFWEISGKLKSNGSVFKERWT